MCLVNVSFVGACPGDHALVLLAIYALSSLLNLLNVDKKFQANSPRNDTSQLTCSPEEEGAGTGDGGARGCAVCRVRVWLVVGARPCHSVCTCCLGCPVSSSTHSVEGSGPSLVSTDVATPGTSAHLAASSQATAAQTQPHVCLGF